MSEGPEKFKASHFNNIEELLNHCDMWIKEDDYDAYCRFFDMGAMEELRNYFIKLNKENQQLKEQLHESSIRIQELIEQDISCPTSCKKLQQRDEVIENAKDYLLKKLYAVKNSMNDLDLEIYVSKTISILNKYKKEESE